ncbi:trypsin-like serine peptidase [Legionella tucsonensis]|nr:trypsin-like serine protease [Legionella tucsonensis]
MMKTILKTCFCVATLCSTHLLFAASAEVGVENKQPEKSILDYWTPERLMNAKEMPYPQVNPSEVEEIDRDLLNSEEPQEQEGAPPEEDIKLDEMSLIPENLLNQKVGGQTFFDRGTSGYNFTSSRLNPITADLTYPYRTVGKLFFTVPGMGNYVCSAAVINRRIILTAGHCVHSGRNGISGYYTNFLFVPAFRDGRAPLRAWSWRYVLTTTAWSTGGGIVPNAADYAMIEANDIVINGIATRVGSLAGYIGWRTSSLIPNHVHLLGYPCNLDSCQKMHQVTAQSARAVAPNNVEYGSDMAGGSSGGPWVQNFGGVAAGQTGGLNPARNAIVGVTSYGYTDTRIKLQGSSILDSRFVSLLNSMCAHRSGNCG